MKLRIRSLIESLKLAGNETGKNLPEEPFQTTPVFTDECRKRKMLIPFFTPFLSPLIPAVMKVAGYDVENLPLSDTESWRMGIEIC